MKELRDLYDKELNENQISCFIKVNNFFIFSYNMMVMKCMI